MVDLSMDSAPILCMQRMQHSAVFFAPESQKNRRRICADFFSVGAIHDEIHDGAQPTMTFARTVDHGQRLGKSAQLRDMLQ